ncbi:restriction endonuclease [Algoriella sp.]|uniref:restriction endonuclease n=1 Tax=Algoriella sp. TaxID=1872434 RepID=UPI002FC83280
MNENIKYEKFAQEIYQELLDKEGLTVEVKHNVKIQGKSSKHQIDVYWEYTFAGVNHKVAIECKNYNKKLNIGIVRNFYGTLEDIGNIQGIIVTKVGYQKGAKLFAEGHGINLIVIREPQSDDWNGRIKTIVTDVEAISQNAKKWFVQLDYEWCKINIPENQLNLIEVKISGMNNEIWIYDNNGNRIKNFLQLQDELPVIENQNSDNKYVYEFDNAYIKSENLGNIKIKAIQITYDTFIDKAQWVFDGENATKAILKNVLTGEMKFIKKDDT